MDLSGINLDDCLRVANEAALIAGSIMLKCIQEQSSLHIQEKSNEVDLVSQYDKQCEDEVRACLKKYTPNYVIIGEESYKPEDLEHFTRDVPTWIVDPIDGTTSFVHRSFDCCVSIGLALRGVPILGVIHVPMMNETYTAITGRGAFCNGKPLRVSGHKTLPGALISIHYSSNRSEERIDTVQKIAKELLKGPVHALRMMGSAALDMAGVASGRLDGYIHRGVSCWDIAAGTVLIREAGGFVADFTMGGLDMKKKELVCAGSEDLALLLNNIGLKYKY
eukprot:PhF_6_TR40825/c0_g1_i1/m.61779/K01092/E3.1.3.25, IMPA, suhB; myo-inositol-1(or 4)-monophosphatase